MMVCCELENWFFVPNVASADVKDGQTKMLKPAKNNKTIPI
jgi:hypothetical protein